MDISTIVARHSNSVALSFSDFGFYGPVTPLTFSAMVIQYGDRFLNRLNQHIMAAGYDGENPQLVKFANQEMALDEGGGGMYLDPGVVLMPPTKANDIFEEPIEVMNPPALGVYGDPADTTSTVVTATLEPIAPSPSIAPVAAAPQVDPMAIANGDQSYYPAEYPAATAVPATTAAVPVVPGEESFFKKNQTAVIIAVIVLILVLLTRRSTPVIIK